MHDQKNKLKNTVIEFWRRHSEYKETAAGYTEGIEKSQKYCSVILTSPEDINAWLLVSTWYRPPDSNIVFLQYFEEFLRKMDDENKEITIAGDFNCDLLKKDCVSRSIKKMKDLIDIYQLQQHIDKPSRITNSSQTLLDIILTKIEDTKMIDSGVIELGISDHSLVYICRKISIPKGNHKLVETRQFRYLNSTEFQSNLRKAFCNFNHYTNTDPSLAWLRWREIFLQIADKHAPLRLRKVKSEYTP